MDTIRLITEAGFMINLKKCRFLVSTMALLGFAVCKAEYHLGAKVLSKLLSVSIPETLHDLQKVLE